MDIRQFYADAQAERPFKSRTEVTFDPQTEQELWWDVRDAAVSMINTVISADKKYIDRPIDHTVVLLGHVDEAQILRALEKQAVHRLRFETSLAPTINVDPRYL